MCKGGVGERAPRGQKGVAMTTWGRAEGADRRTDKRAPARPTGAQSARPLPHPSPIAPSKGARPPAAARAAGAPVRPCWRRHRGTRCAAAGRATGGRPPPGSAAPARAWARARGRWAPWRRSGGRRARWRRRRRGPGVRGRGGGEGRVVGSAGTHTNEHTSALSAQAATYSKHILHKRAAHHLDVADVQDARHQESGRLAAAGGRDRHQITALRRGARGR